MKEFIWNDCGVCINANKVSDKYKRMCYDIATAHSERGWTGALRISGSTWDWCEPLMHTDKDVFFDNEETCIRYHANRIYEYLKKREGDNAQPLLDSLKEIIKPKHIQLELF